jgi:uncharacterized SAM-binding protein YcdF (DUF218 family)
VLDLNLAIVIWIKPLLGSLIAPLPIALALIGLGLLLRWRGQQAKLSRLLLVVGFAIPIMASNNGLANTLVRQFEDDYPAAFVTGRPTTDTPPLAYIAVLGGGHAENDQLPHFTQLSYAARARLVEGLRLARIFPEAKLLVCGPRGKRKDNTHAAMLARAAAELGLATQRLILLDEVYDTHDEILAIQAVAGTARVGLTTSAWHMPRAMGLAQKAGLNAQPCPADYLAPQRQDSLWDWLSFSTSSIETTSRAVRESLGLVWTKLRGQR